MRITFIWLLFPLLLEAKEIRQDFESADQTETPAAFIYDPVSGSSLANRASARLSKDLEIAVPRGSFTLEAYVKPASIPKQNVPIMTLPRSSKAGTEVSAGLRWLSNFKQCYWGGALLEAGSTRPVRWSTGHYVTISRLRDDTIGWRHLALVYDENEKTVTVWLDHWQAGVQALTEPLSIESSKFVIQSAFDGLIDSLRVTDKALGPEHFLRATNTALKNVTFDVPALTLPDDAGHLNIRKHFGAVGDGATDDTDAIRRAFSSVNGLHATRKGSCVLYFPAGTYLVSDQVKWSRFLRVQGESKDNTIIKLKDSAAGFSDPENPRSVVAASAVKGRPGSNKAVNGSTIANWFHHFTVDTGSGNPGAIAVEYHSNNYGSLEHVRIRSGDGAGVVGLDLSHKTNGPTLIAHTEIDGFDTGILCKYMEYSITMEDVTLSNQKQVGILNSANILALNRITSHNQVPAIRSQGGFGLVSLLNSNFSGGSPEVAAIESSHGLYARNVKIGGYGKSIAKEHIIWNPHKKPNFNTVPGKDLTGDIEEYIGDKSNHPEGKTARALALPIVDAPQVPVGDIKNDWVNVTDFSELTTMDGKKQDWAAAIEAAFATGKPTVYFPRGGYHVSRVVSVPPSVKRLYGMDNGISKGGLADKRNPGYETQPAVLRIEGDTEDPLLLDFFSVAMLEHVSSRPVVLRHARYAYRGLPGAGNVFIRDCVSPWWSFAPGQKVWARQWNVESHSDGPCVYADKATIWALGFKTEYESQKLRAVNGSAVEIYGSFIYPVVKGIPQDRPVFEIIDSDFSAQWGLSVYTARHFLQVRDVKGGTVRDTTMRDGAQLGPRIRFDFYSNR